jgi:light-regulated signal transduction histidine kinase (bacteriophytochrome)
MQARRKEDHPVQGAHCDKEVSAFLLRACHDLRSATRAMRMHSEMFLADPGLGSNEATRQHLGFLVDGAKTLDLLVDGIAGYSVALETGAEPLQSLRMDVLLRTVLRTLSNQLSEAGAEVVYGDLPEIAGDPDRLMQVLRHLLSNALLYRGGAPPRVSITAELNGDEWVFAVRDNGPGVEAALLDNIFVPFQRLPGAKRTSAGMGLAICRVIVQRHGGRIWAESPEGSGITMYFTLPAKL